MGVRPTVVLGVVVIALLFGGFGARAAFAPLETAAIALLDEEPDGLGPLIEKGDERKWLIRCGWWLV